MRNDASEAPPAITRSAEAADFIAVLAKVDPSSSIVGILKRESLAFRRFDGEAALEAFSGSGNPSVIVLWMEDTVSGLTNYIGSLNQTFEQAPIVVVCSSIERWGVREALMSGACGVVLREDLDRALAPSIRAVMAGQTCVPRNHQRQIHPPALSNREKQILGLVVMGFSNSQIAQQLFLAESTVKSHLSSAFGKLGVRSRNDAVHLILDPERGLGMGILALGGESMESAATPAL